jgi:hypothetical protein
VMSKPRSTRPSRSRSTLVFNIGGTAFAKSTLLKKLNARGFRGGSGLALAGKHVLPLLHHRSEVARCSSLPVELAGLSVSY